MAASTPFALTSDVQARYPSEAAILCADETTRQPDWSRFDAAVADASAEIRAVLASRYNAALLAAVDGDALAFLNLCAIDIAMYRVALSFGRSTEQIRDRYDVAVKRLEQIALGKGALNPALPAAPSFPDGSDLSDSTPQEAIVDYAPPRWGRERWRGF